MSESTVSFSTDQTSAPSYPDENRVGQLYEVGINGVGYMLADSPDLKYRRQVAPIEAQRFATQGAPFDEKVDHYTFGSYYDWSAGAGQKHGNRPTTEDNRFWDSDLVDVLSEPGRLKLLHKSTGPFAAITYGNPLMASLGTNLYILTSATQLSYSTGSSSLTNIALTAAQTVTDLCEDGNFWYAAHGGAANGIARGTTTATLNWSAIVAERIWWAGQRICVSYKVGGVGTPRTFSTLADAGTEEIAAGRLTLPAGWTIVPGGSGGGFVYFGAYAGDRGLIYKWQIGSTDAPSVALELPRGVIPRHVLPYQGQVMVMATNGVGPGGHLNGVVYRCPQETSGNLTLFTVVELTPTYADMGVGQMVGTGRFVFFPWPYMDGLTSTSPAGIGAIDLSTGAYSKWLHAATAYGGVPSIVFWGGLPVFAVAGTDVFQEHPSIYAPSGWLEESLADGGSVLSKVWDEVRVGCAPLNANESIDVAYSTNDGVSYTTLSAAHMATVGTTAKTTTLAKKSRSLGLKVTLATATDLQTTPTVDLVSKRYHMLGLADSLLQLAVNCSDQLVGLDGRPLPEAGSPGSGAARARALEALAQTRVRLQDLDWPTTHTAETWEVISVDTSNVSVFDRSVNHNALAQVALVTLRKVAK